MQQPYAHFKQTPHTGFPNTPPTGMYSLANHSHAWVGGAFKMTMVFSYTNHVRNISIADKAKKEDIRYYIFDVLMYFTFSSFDSNPFFTLHISASRQINILKSVWDVKMLIWSTGDLLSKGRKHLQNALLPHMISHETDWASTTERASEREREQAGLLMIMGVRADCTPWGCVACWDIWQLLCANKHLWTEWNRGDPHWAWGL